MRLDHRIFNFELSLKQKMKGVFKWGGSVKKQKHSIRSSVDKAAFFCLAKLLNLSNTLHGERRLAQNVNTKKRNVGHDQTDLLKRKARPGSSGQGSDLLHQSVPIGADLMFLNSGLVWFGCQFLKTGTKNFLIKKMHATQVKIAGNAIQLFIHCLNRNIKKCCNFLDGKILGTHSKYSYVTLHAFKFFLASKIPTNL